MKIEILLPTYNSELFLDELFNSLEGQSRTDWHLLIRDDGSTDSTLRQIGERIKKDPVRYSLIDNRGENLGPKASFIELMAHSSADYLMFCDHDDVWLPHKIGKTLERLLEIETEHPGKPVLVCTDLVVADAQLKTIHPSFWSHSRIDTRNVNNLYRLAINNVVVGCTTMINRAAVSVALPIPGAAVMHDWWIGLRVAQHGVIGLIDEPTILYRQHARNAIGARPVTIANRLGLSHLRQTYKNNLDAYRMLKTLMPDCSLIRLIGYKLEMSLYRYTRR